MNSSAEDLRARGERCCDTNCHLHMMGCGEEGGWGEKGGVGGRGEVVAGCDMPRMHERDG